MVVMAVGAIPAFAHHPIVSGNVVCDDETGDYTITWTVANGNWEGRTMTLDRSNRAAVQLSSFAPDETKTYTETLPGTTDGTTTLSVRGDWSDGGPQDVVATASVDANGSCSARQSTPTPEPEPEKKHTICHATSSTTNPYSGREETINPSKDGVLNGHLDHTGPVPTSQAHLEQLKDAHDWWGDIIPPFEWDGQTFSLNWPAGQAIFENGCALPDEEEPTPTPEPEPEKKHTICHATSSTTNPYSGREETINPSKDGVLNGHLDHTGPVPTSQAHLEQLKDAHDWWGDIIPPFEWDGQTFSLNWPAGQAIFENGCALPDEPAGEPDLDIEKEAEDGSVNAGDEIGYTITVSNDGDGAAEDVELTDELPDDAGLDWAIDGTTGGWDCEIAQGILTCGGDGFDLEPGEEASVTITSPTTAETCGTVRNQASASMGDGDGQDQIELTTIGGPDDVLTDVVSITVTCLPDLDIEKEAEDGSVNAGDEIGYTITVSNDGDGAAEDVELTDELPDDAGLDWAIDGTTGGWDCEIAQGILTCGGDGFDLEPSEEASVTITSPTTAETCGTVRNQASAESSNSGDDEDGEPDLEGDGTDEGDLDDEVDSDVELIRVRCTPDIDIDKDGPSVVHRGDTITYEFAVTNVGQVDLYDVVLIDPICDEGTISLVDDGDGDDVLAVGEEWEYQCTRLVTDEDPDPLPNTATVRGDTEEGEGGDQVSDEDGHVVDIINPAIDVVKTVSSDTVPVGATVTYTYVVTNTGDTTLYDISVDDDVIGHIGDIDVLEPAESVTLKKDFVVGNEVVVNIAIVRGNDVMGRSVIADDDAVVFPIAGGTTPKPPTTPFTGSDAGRLGLLSLLVSGIGLTLVAATRRWRSRDTA